MPVASGCGWMACAGPCGIRFVGYRYRCATRVRSLVSGHMSDTRAEARVTLWDTRGRLPWTQTDAGGFCSGSSSRRRSHERLTGATGPQAPRARAPTAARAVQAASRGNPVDKLAPGGSRAPFERLLLALSAVGGRMIETCQGSRVAPSSATCPA